MSIIWQPPDDDLTGHWRARARELTERHFAPLAEELDRDQRYPYESVEILRDSGISTMFLPQIYGGHGAPLRALCAAVEEISKGCASTGAIVAAVQLGAFPILLDGTEEQKQRFLGGLVERGDAVCFALSERAAGSDAAAITTTAEREGEGYRIRGEKCWLGNGGVSRHYIVFAKTDPAAGGRGITAFMVDKEQDGVAIDFFEDKMGIRGTLTSNLKLDVRVPESAILGTPGRGFGLALRTLNVGRVTVAAQAIGIGRAAFEAAASWAAGRTAFGKTVIEHQAIGFRLADVATELSAARMLLDEAARRYDQGDDVTTAGAMAKLYASEVSHRAVDAAVQTHGGYGYVKPTPVERYYRDQRIVEIYEGTSEIQRLVLARAIKSEAERHDRSRGAHPDGSRGTR